MNAMRPASHSPEGPTLRVVVRASGERTEPACIGLLTSQLREPPTMIRERPFSRAVAKTLELGVATEAEWLVAVDADMLVVSDFVERVRGMCARMPHGAFCATPISLCRVVGGFVFRGVHLYRTALLGDAAALARDLDPALRPESAVQHAMAERGHPKRFLAHAVGVHDHEQSLAHLYLKAKLRARKDEDSRSIHARLLSRAADDTDALVSSWGFADAADERTPPTEYDWTAPLPRLAQRLAMIGLRERPPFKPALGRGYAERMLRAHDYAGDTITAAWIRDRLGFDRGAPAIVTNLAMTEGTA